MRRLFAAFGIVALMSWLILLTQAAHAQNGSGPSSSSTWTGVMHTFATADTAALTGKHSKSTEWFPHSKTLYAGDDSWKSHFQQVGDAHRASGKLLSVADAKAEVGDIVLLESAPGTKTSPLVMIYAGERAFADDKLAVKRSFFVYPYQTRCEFNTFPPRLHRQLLTVMLRDSGLEDSLGNSFKFSPPERLVVNSHTQASGEWTWLQKPTSLGKPPLFYPSKRWQSGATIRILRAASGSVFLAEAKKMPCHQQLFHTPDQKTKLNELLQKTTSPPTEEVLPGGTCYWQAYSDALAYQSRSFREITQENVLRMERNLIAKYLDPMSTHDPRLEKGFRTTNLAKRLTEEQRQLLIEYNKLWEFWEGPDANRELAESKLRLRYHDADDHEAFIRVVETALRADRPVLASVLMREWTDKKPAVNDVGKIAEEPYDFPVKEVSAEVAGKVEGGHIVLIVGLAKTEGDARMVYFQDGNRAGEKPGDYIDALLSNTHVVKMNSKEFWNKLLRHSKNLPFYFESRVIPPLRTIGE